MSAAGAPAAPGGARVPAPAPGKHADVARSWDAVLPGSGSAVRVVVGRPLEDCKSFFIGTLVFPVRTAREALDGVAMVRELQLLAGVCHFIAAFQAADGSCFQDDDGEKRGGAATLAAVLSRERVVGCVVVVARWFGGVVLDQHRIFTHIEQRARLLLQAVGQRRGDTMTLEDTTVGAGAPEPEASSSKPVPARPRSPVRPPASASASATAALPLPQSETSDTGPFSPERSSFSAPGTPEARCRAGGEGAAGAAGAEGVVGTAGAAGAAEDSSGSCSDGLS